MSKELRKKVAELLSSGGPMTMNEIDSQLAALGDAYTTRLSRRRALYGGLRALVAEGVLRKTRVKKLLLYYSQDEGAEQVLASIDRVLAGGKLREGAPDAEAFRRRLVLLREGLAAMVWQIDDTLNQPSKDVT